MADMEGEEEGGTPALPWGLEKEKLQPSTKWPPPPFLSQEHTVGVGLYAHHTTGEREGERWERRVCFVCDSSSSERGRNEMMISTDGQNARHELVSTARKAICVRFGDSMGLLTLLLRMTTTMGEEEEEEEEEKQEAVRAYGEREGRDCAEMYWTGTTARMGEGITGWGVIRETLCTSHSDILEYSLALPPLAPRRVGITSSKIKGFTLGTHTKSRFQKHKEEVCPPPPILYPPGSHHVPCLPLVFHLDCDPLVIEAPKRPGRKTTTRRRR
jgi:hypothetical protein